MNGNIPSILVIDSTYLLPAFGVDVDFDSGEEINTILGRLTGRGSKIYISDLSPLECFLKAFRLAEKEGKEDGKKSARAGLLAVTREVTTFRTLSYSDEQVLTEASEIRNSHKDPFDCFIFGTAKVLDAPLLTEDSGARKYLSSSGVLSWKSLRKLLR